MEETECFGMSSRWVTQGPTRAHATGGARNHQYRRLWDALSNSSLCADENALEFQGPLWPWGPRFKASETGELVFMPI